jgi:hypothetical protein
MPFLKTARQLFSASIVTRACRKKSTDGLRASTLVNRGAWNAPGRPAGSQVPIDKLVERSGRRIRHSMFDFLTRKSLFGAVDICNYPGRPPAVD